MMRAVAAGFAALAGGEVSAAHGVCFSEAHSESAALVESARIPGIDIAASIRYSTVWPR